MKAIVRRNKKKRFQGEIEDGDLVTLIELSSKCLERAEAELMVKYPGVTEINGISLTPIDWEKDFPRVE